MQQEGYPPGFESSADGPEHGRCLIVILHGWLGTPAKMGDVVQAVREAYGPKPDLYVPLLDYANFFSTIPAAEIVKELFVGMNAICGDPARYEHIVLIGYSLGAVIARRLFLAATDVHETVPNEKELADAGQRHWSDKVERIVSLGGLNRGWLGSGRLGWVYSLIANLLGLMGHLWPGARYPITFEVRRGAPFIVQTRLQWLEWRQSRETEDKPLVIQLLGTQDSLVAPDDAVDFAVDRDPKKPYFYFELPHTRHDNAYVFSPSRFERRILRIFSPKRFERIVQFGDERKARFIAALKWRKEELVENQIRAEYLADTLPDKPDPDVEHVVFVIHGIRDDGYWTRKIAQKIREKAPPSDPQTGKSKWRCVTSSYGYFAMLPFLLPWVRTQKVEWLMDLYVDTRSRFPKAKFSYVGHSNGTYLVAHALEVYPAACFRNVLFAGSVVRRDYDWKYFIAAKRVNKVVNMVATHDWVVAIFPKGLEPLRKSDLGGAGFDGFDQPEVKDVEYVIGGHSAALVETQWPRIAEFIVNDKEPARPDNDYSDHQCVFWRNVSKVSTLLLAALVIAAAAILAWILYPIFAEGTTTREAVERVLGAVLYLMALRFIITRL